MDLIDHSARGGPTRKVAADARLVCYVYRSNYDVPCAEITVDGTLGRAKARAERLLAANPLRQVVEIFRGEECLLRITKPPLPCAA
jgi:hypothetical protein